MKKRILGIAVLLIILFAGGASIFLSSKESTPDAEVLSTQTQTPKIQIDLSKLEIFSGEVEVNTIKAQNGQEIEIGSTIKTLDNSRAQILYPNNSVTRLDENSEIVLEQFNQNPNQTAVKIDKGRIWNRIVKLLGKEDSFESKTDMLVASVRGTSFGHGILADGSNKITVSKSEVKVDCVSNNFEASLTPNKKVTSFCKNTFSVINWNQDEAGDEWFNWNKLQDDEQDKRFGGSLYVDQSTPTPKATLKPTIKPTATPSPSPSPTITPTPTASPSPTPTLKPRVTPTPTPTPFIIF